MTATVGRPVVKKLLLSAGRAAFRACLFLSGLMVFPAAAQFLPPVKTVFVIAMENHNFTQPNPTSSPQQIRTNPAAPYINSLITVGNSNAVQVSFCTHYYNAGIGVHPSEPSYVWAEAGTDFGVHTDNDPSAGSGNIFTAPHLTSQLNAAGITWKNYQEDVQLSSGPKASASGTSGSVINPYYGTGQYNYAAKHNPMVFFSDTQTQNVRSFIQFGTDLTNHAFGRYNWITPNQYNDQHSALSGGFTYHGTAYTGDQAAIAQGDNFLSILIPKIMATPEYQDNGMIVIRWDESEGGDTTSYAIPYILISPLAKGNAYSSSVEMNHSSLIKTMEEILGLAFLTNAIPAGETRAAGSGYNTVASVNDMSDLFKPVAKLALQHPAGTTLTNGSAIAFGTVAPGSSLTNLFTITNSGNGTLVLTNMPLSGAHPADFAVSGMALPASLGSGATATFKLVFTPAACGARSATLQITNNDSSFNPFSLALSGTGNGTPQITGQPLNQTNHLGTTAAFTVGATACTSMSYQWYFGANALAAQTNNTLSLTSVVWTNAGDYHVVITSSGGSTNSSAATLSVLPEPPTLTAGQWTGNGGFQLSFAGPATQPYKVLASDDPGAPLASWTLLATGTFGDTNAVFTDTDATNHPGRFYCIKSP